MTSGAYVFFMVWLTTSKWLILLSLCSITLVTFQLLIWNYSHESIFSTVCIWKSWSVFICFISFSFINVTQVSDVSQVNIREKTHTPAKIIFNIILQQKLNKWITLQKNHNFYENWNEIHFQNINQYQFQISTKMIFVFFFLTNLF